MFRVLACTTHDVHCCRRPAWSSWPGPGPVWLADGGATRRGEQTPRVARADGGVGGCRPRCWRCRNSDPSPRWPRACSVTRLAGRRVEDAGHESAGDSRSLRRRAGIGKSACVSGRRRDETRTAKEAGVSIGRWPSAGEVSPVGQGAGSSSASQPPMVAFRQRDAPTSSGAVNERLPGSTGAHVVEPGERRCVDAGHRTDVGDCEVPDAPEGPWAASSTDERACLRSRVWTLERHVERTGECGGYRGS
jgi:hypothetical protein